jgi:ribosomal protein L37AE/L43A
MRRPRNPTGRLSNPLRELLAERNRAAEVTRLHQRERGIAEDLPSLIDERVGAQMEKLETKLVEGFREMGQRVVEESTNVLTSSLDGRITQLEEISLLQTETINHLRDSSRDSERKVSGVVNTIEKALSDAVPGFRLAPPSHLPPQLNSPAATRELVRSRDRSIEDSKIPDAYCPKCTSTNVRRASRSGMWEEFLRLFFIAPFRCRACRHKFYRF